MGRGDGENSGRLTAVFDRYAGDYDQKFNQNPIARYQREIVWQALLPYCKPGVRLLDAGCGPGSDFGFFCRQELSVTAFDLSPQMIKMAGKAARQLDWPVDCSVSSIMAFRSSQQFDVVLLNFGVLNAVENATANLLHLGSFLKSGGIMVAVVMPPLHFLSAVEQLLRLQWKGLFDRIVRSRALLPDDVRFYYHSDRILPESYRLVHRLTAGALLPNPDQFRRYTWLQPLSLKTINLSKKWEQLMPAFCGADHVCYILQKPDG